MSFQCKSHGMWILPYEIQYLYTLLQHVRPSTVSSDCDIYRGNMIVRLRDWILSHSDQLEDATVEPDLPF